MNTDVLYKQSQGDSIWSQWRQDIRCVFSRDPAARNVLEVVTTYPGVQAILLHRLSHLLWGKGWQYPARFVSFFGRVWSNVDIHPGAHIGNRFFIDHGACVVIGETAIVGDDVTLYHGVTLGGTSWNKGRRHPRIGNGVLIGAGAKVLGAIDIGDNVRIGANSVVVEEVPQNCTVVGIPGKVVKSKQNAPANNRYGIDLDHHLIPDPVGKAISCLISRIDYLEECVADINVQKPSYQEVFSESCDVDNDFCEKDCAIGASVVEERGKVA